MDFIERIGPILGVAAFLGFSILTFLLIIQAREVKRLREWAGRAPERSQEAVEATQAAAEARGEAEAEGEERYRLRHRIADRFGGAWDAVDRRSPVDPRFLVAGLLALIVAAGVLTSGFGLIGSDDEPQGRRAGKGAGQSQNREQREKPQRPPSVAVLNATQVETDAGVIQAVPGLAGAVADQIVEPAGYRVRTEDTAPTGSEVTQVMYEEGSEDAAQALAEALEPQLGQIEVAPMTEEIRALADGALLALLVGSDNADVVTP